MTEDAYQADHLAQGRRHTVQEHFLRYDLVVTPYRSQYLTGPAEQVTNITLQAKCLLDLTDHFFIIYDPAALHWVGHALLRDGPASPTFRPRSLDHGAACSPRALPAAGQGAGSGDDLARGPVGGVGRLAVDRLPLLGPLKGYPGGKVAAKVSNCLPSALRIADLITGPSSLTGPVIRQSATRLTRVPSPSGAHS